MMAYIDVGKLLKELTTSPDGTKIPDVDCDNFPIKIDLRLLKRIILRQPTADVVEVKHGYWKDRYGNKYDNHLYECSVCGKKALYEIYSDELQQTKIRQVLSNACPHCLAKMDGKENNHETN